jgi:hypothetical protein
MNIKILAAVLTTLTAVFVVMNAGNAPQAPETGQGLQGLIPDIFSQENPEPQTAVTAEITFLTNNTTMNVNGDTTIQGLDTYTSDAVNIRSDKDIEFQNFEGQMFFGNRTEVSGKAYGFISKGVEVEQTFRLEKTLNNTKVDIKDAERVGLEFSQADISLDAENSSSGITETNTSVRIESFSGNITVTPGLKTVNLDGNISKVEAGQTTFGGN